jgi:putative hemolysin
MSGIVAELLILLLLLVANGIFAMTEIAIVSVRKVRLRHLAEKGDTRAVAALDLAESPDRFLSTVQVGITLVGILAGALGGATLSEKLAIPLSQIPWLAPYAPQVALGIVVLGITYLSLILGELVPKRIGLGNPEGVALAMAKFMQRLSRVAGPIVGFLTKSTGGLLSLCGLKPVTNAAISEDEVRILMREGERAGAFNRVESHIIHRALELDQLTVRDLMTPRPKIIFLNKADPHETIWHKIVVSGHSHFPVYENQRDNVVGLLSVKAIYANLAAGTAARTADLMTKPLLVPTSQTAIQLLDVFKHQRKHLALVADEFGAIVGLVTLHDVMEALVGEFPSLEERSRPAIKRRDDGTWLIDGLVELERVENELPGFRPGGPLNRDFQTLAGYIVKKLGHLPHEGETVLADNYVFEVLDMDRHRVDKVLVTRTPATATAG